jgi:hypothetical protein
MFEKRYRLLWDLAKDFHKAQAKTLVALTVALVGCGKMRSFHLSHQLARTSGVRFKSALQRFYRWVHNPNFDELACWSALADRVLSLEAKRPLIAVDWTEWHQDRRVLLAAACVGSRAVAVFAQAFSKTDMPRSQNTRENTFIDLLTRLSTRMKDAVLIFDRGFRRVSLIKQLNWLRQPFIIRLAAKVHVRCPHYQGLLYDHPLRPGQRIDLGNSELSARSPVRVRVVGIWAQGQAEPWWMATSLSGSLKRVSQYYDRRMGVEEQFRDTKGARYGAQMKWTAFQSSQAIGRIYLLVALATVCWLAAGLLALCGDPTLALPSKRKGPRRSTMAIGVCASSQTRHVLSWNWRGLRKFWPPLQLRKFSW